MSLKSIMIFEPETGGHHAEYLKVLINYHLVHNHNIILCLVVDQKIVGQMEMVSSQLSGSGSIEVIPLSEEELNKCKFGPLIVRSYYCWRVCKKYAELKRADHVFFLFLDLVQWPLAFRLSWPKHVKVSGIMFQTSIHYKYFGMAPRESLIEAMKRIRKQIILFMAASNSVVDTIFSMDDSFYKYSKSHFPKGMKVFYIPDPACMTKHFVGDQILPDSESDKIVFLLFGALDARKGVFEVLKAIDCLNEKTKEKVSFWFAGKVKEKYKALFYEKLEAIDTTMNVELVRITDRFLTNDELKEAVVQSDVILAPYQRFVGSSGVLLWAASAEKPVIAQDYGLVGAWVKKYRLGVTVDTCSSQAIAEAVSLLSEDRKGYHDSILAGEFIEQHNTNAFAAGVFNALIDRSGK